MTSRPGRPINEERQLALLTGETTYVGKRCKSCGGTERYAKGGSCVACVKDSSDKVRRATRTKRRRRDRRAEAALEAELGLIGNSVEVERGLHTENFSSTPPEAVDGITETRVGTHGTARIAHGSGLIIPDVSGLGIPEQETDAPNEIGTGVIHPLQKGILGSGSVPAPDSVDEPMASSGVDVDSLGVPAENIKTRYWCHPESGCVWTTPGTDSESDGLVEEISAETYADLVKAGFIVNHEDDLSDIL